MYPVIVAVSLMLLACAIWYSAGFGLKTTGKHRQWIERAWITGLVFLFAGLSILFYYGSVGLAAYFGVPIP